MNDLVSQLPPWVRENRFAPKDERQAWIAERVRQNLIDVEPILKDFRDAGFAIANLQDLCRREIGHKDLVPIILKWLHDSPNLSMKSALASALAVPWARNTDAPLAVLDLFESLPSELTDLKWTLGNALAEIADSRCQSRLVAIVIDKRHGRSRQMAVIALARTGKCDRVLDALVNLLDDEDVAGHAVIALRKLKAKEKLADIARMTEHPTTWIRTEAKKAIKSFSK